MGREILIYLKFLLIFINFYYDNYNIFGWFGLQPNQRGRREGEDSTPIHI